MPRLRSSACGAATLLSALGAAPLSAQSPPVGADSVTMAAGPEYRAGGLHRLLLGAHWRALWTAPVTVPLLDLETFDGGVVPVRRGGGLQTRSLRLRSASGREWTVRSVDKDPSSILPPSLRETVLDRIVEDQTSAGHPFAALVVPPLLDAAGVLHVEPQLVRIPDDAPLGEFGDFAGMLGMLEERPEEGPDGEAGFAGASEIVGTEKMLERVEERAGHAVDVHAYLRARLMDLLLGDWDRHVDQWRWARRDSAGRALWRPIPRDRDQAFAKYDGVLLWFARQRAPQLVDFGPTYGPAIGLAWNARVLDRRLLPPLAWPAWEAEVAELQRRVHDRAIAAATAELPRGVPAGSAEALAATLRARRDALPAAARALYDLLAGEVDVHLTDADEVVQVERLPDSTRITVATTTRSPTFRRTFLHRETDEIRLWMHGGDDRFGVQGEGGPLLRALGGGGRDSLLSEPRGARLYDRGGQWRGPDGRDVAAREERWAPGDSAYPPRDWGGARFGLPVLAAGPDVGIVVGASLAWERYGFRQLPYAHRFDVRAAWAFGADAGLVEARWDDRLERSRARVELLARASGIWRVGYYGFGNETPRSDDERFHRALVREYLLRGEYVLPLGRSVEIGLGPEVRLTGTDTTGSRLLALEQPYGSGDFGRLAVRAEVRVDTRDDRVQPSRGLRVSLGGDLSPAVWDVEQTYGTLAGDAAAYAAPWGRGAPVLALRIGGRQSWGNLPFQDAAYVGGAATLRGLPEQRFAGSASLYAGAELRQRLGTVSLLLPLRVGIFGFGETGRVWTEEDSSRRWHAAGGGGFWLSALDPGAVFSVALAQSDDGFGVYLRAGFGW